MAADFQKILYLCRLIRKFVMKSVYCEILGTIFRLIVFFCIILY